MKRKNVEVWYCPSGYTIKKHSHPEENIELMYILGKTTFYRERESKIEKFTPRYYHMFRSFSVNAGDNHWFDVANFPLVFINVATFLEGKKPKSASVDFSITN
jgi:hypothetical protein